MNIVIDLILVAIIAYCAWRGFKNGIIRGICGFLGLLVALYGANIVASVYSPEFTGMLNPFVSGVVDTSVSKVLEYDGTEIEEEDRISFSLRDTDDEEDEEEKEKSKSSRLVLLTDAEKEDVYTVCFASCRYLGLAESASDIVAAKVAENTASVGQRMSADLSDGLCETLSFALVYAVAFTLIAIVFAVIGNLINLTFRIPGIEKVESYVGLAIGILRGILLVMIIMVLFRYAGMLISDEVIDKTILPKLLINSNPVAKRIGL